MADTSRLIQNILCAVRGGAETRMNTFNRAIDIALEHKSALTFVNIIDAEFLGYASPTLSTRRVIYQELKEMSKFALLLLCESAKKRGIEDVNFIVLEGNIRKRLEEIAVETNAEVFVMGKPIKSPGSNVFKVEEYDKFIRFLKQETNMIIESV